MFLKKLLGSKFEGKNILVIKDIFNLDFCNTEPKVSHVFKHSMWNVYQDIVSLSWGKCNFIALGRQDGTIDILDIKNRKLIYSFKGHSDWVRSIDWHPRVNLMVSGGGKKDKCIKIWNIKTSGCELIHSLVGHSNRIHSVKYSPCGMFIASGDGNGTIRIWNADKGTIVEVFEGNILSGAVNSLCYKPDDSSYIAAGYHHGLVKIWNIEKKEIVKKFNVASALLMRAIYSVCYNPSGSTIATGDVLGFVSILDANAGKSLCKFTNNSIITGGDQGVSTVCYSPCGEFIASEHEINVIYINNAKTQKKLAEYKTGCIIEGKGNGLCYSPCGRFLALRATKTVVVLCLSSNRMLNSQETQQILNALKVDTNITILNLSEMELKIENINTLYELLSINKSIISVDLSKTNVDLLKDAPVILSKLLATNTTLKILNLSNNNLKYKFIIMLAEGISKNPSLEELDLSGNFIRYDEVKEIVKSAKKCTTLHTINLQNNIISIEYNDLHNLLHSITQSKLESVNILHNNLGCTKIHKVSKKDEPEGIGYFQLLKPRKKLVKKLIFENSLQGGLFFQINKSIDLVSYLDTNRSLNKDRWVISLARNTEGNQPEHAVIFLEGIRSFGQRFIQKIHLVTEDGYSNGNLIELSIKKAFIETEFYDLDRFVGVKKDYAIMSWSIMRKPEAKNLQRVVLNDVVYPPKYRQLDSKLSKMFDSKTEEVFNCFTYAKSRLLMLKDADTREQLVIDQSWIDQFFPNASKVLKKRQGQDKRCSIQ